jgi:NADH-quinone oxidoreductase subunit F
LIRSIEGARGMPRLRPPYPAQKGLWGMPTLINNCETFASVPWILRNGPERFRAIGTVQSAGTKVFSLTGKIRHGGLIEVPMGMTLREIVEEVGGGIANNLSFKAVQIGGPSGGCIPAAHADLPVDFGELTSAGAMMGSGGLVVLDERDCMVDIARYFLTFTQSQSCGRCTFCRVGTRRMLDILDRICAGKGVVGDIERLEELAHSVANASLCGLGRTAPNPILSTIRYFRSEYEAHLLGSCPAGKCPDLIAYTITDKCIGCTLCAQTCPTDAIPFTPHERHVINDAACVRCDMCRTGCPTGAIKIVTGAERKSLCQQ